MVRSYQEFMERQAAAAVAISGADHSSWNGRTDVDVRENMSGATGSDGTVYYDDSVTRRLRDMFDNAGRVQDAAVLRGYRDAVRVVLQRNAPLLSPPGQDSRPDDPWVANTTDQAFSDAWTLRNIDRYIDELGLEDVAPGIRSAELDPRLLDDHTARGTEAATLLADYIGSRTGLDTDEVLRRINNETPAGQLPLAAEMLGAPDLEDTLTREFAAQNVGTVGTRTNVVAYQVGSPPPEPPPPPVPQDLVRAVHEEISARSQQPGVPDDAQRAADLLQAGTTPLTASRRLSADQLAARPASSHSPAAERGID